MRVVAFALLAVATSARADDGAAAEAAARAFYGQVLALSAGGLPDERALAALSPALSPGLVTLIDAAVAKEAQCRLDVVGTDKPDIVEGNVFVGSYEGASEVVSLSVDVQPARAIVTARLAYVDPNFPKAHRHRVTAWTDELTLVRSGAIWVVDDVETGEGTLRGFLTEYGAARRRCGERSGS